MADRPVAELATHLVVSLGAEPDVAAREILAAGHLVWELVRVRGWRPGRVQHAVTHRGRTAKERSFLRVATIAFTDLAVRLDHDAYVTALGVLLAMPRETTATERVDVGAAPPELRELAHRFAAMLDAIHACAAFETSMELGAALVLESRRLEQLGVSLDEQREQMRALVGPEWAATVPMLLRSRGPIDPEERETVRALVTPGVERMIAADRERTARRGQS